MRRIFCLFVIILFSSLGHAQCPNVAKTLLSSQDDVDEFVQKYSSCNRIDGSLELTTGLSVAITGLDIGPPIDDLSGLSFIEAVAGDLRINIQTANLDGFKNIKEITGDLEILNSDSIVVFNDLNSLTEVKGNIKITQNNNLEVLNGFNELRFSGGIEIASNENLIEVNAFHNLLEVENTLEIGSEDKIEIIDGFFELHTIGEDFLIRQNPNLLKISSFHKLKSISNNFRIETAKDISGFESLETTGNHFELFGIGIEKIPNFNSFISSGGRFSIEDTSITSFNGLNNLLTVGDASFEDDWFKISNNLKLNSILGFGRFVKVDGFLEVQNNPTLRDCTWLCYILNNGEIKGDLIIQENLGDCSTSAQVILICDPDFDNDGIANVNDLDDDNDGIFDSQEGDSSIDSDNDGYPDSLDLDSDNDECFDAIESGFDDSDGDGILGSYPNPTNINGLINDETTGYKTPLDKDDNGFFDFQEANVLSPGQNAEIGICLNEGQVNLFNMLNGNPDPGGLWTPTLKNGDGIFDPRLDAEGVYTYTHSDAICGSLSAQVKVNVLSELTPGIDTEVIVCEDETEFNLFKKIDGAPSVGGNWLPKLASGTNIYNVVLDTKERYLYVINDKECGTLKSVITFKKYKSPNSGISSSLSICEFSENIDLFESLGGTPDKGGIWSPALPNGILNPRIHPTGSYTYTVNNGSCGTSSSTVDVEVISNSELDNVTINVNDFSATNNQIAIFVASNREYEYSIDGFRYQTDNLFNNVSGGLKTIYIRGLDGCEFYTKEIFVRTYPNFFTPNGDGNNDFWKLQDFPDINYKIYIYSRFGKLIKEIKHSADFWDGIYNGENLQSSDYWFKVVTEKGEVLTGNFSLIRK